MRHVFTNTTPQNISSGRPTDVSSAIEVSGIQGAVRHVSVAVDIDHTFTRDLVVSVEAPNHRRVVLVAREGGSGDNFRRTYFDDRSTSSITNASPPFRGAFRPEGHLSDLNNQDPNGKWTLNVADQAFLDGGSLNGWALVLTTEDEVQSAFNVQVRFGGGLTASQQSVFEAAAERWAEIITGDLPSIRTDIGVVDDVVIDAQGTFIDGVSNTLGQAGPTFFRPDSGLPARGIMSFDTADLDNMERNGSLLNVIIHEMGHVLGIGTIWRRLGLLQGAGTRNPEFTGRAAMREFATLIQANASLPVPVANTGGRGTRDGHWRENIFGNELMTGFLDRGINPLSRMTIAALQDMGYQVNLGEADPYLLPSALELALMGIGGDSEDPQEICCTHAPGPIIVTDEA